MNKFLSNKKKSIKWPNSPDLVKEPNRLIPKFEKYYPSISDMNYMQKSFYKYWQKQYIFGIILDIFEASKIVSEKRYY